MLKLHLLSLSTDKKKTRISTGLLEYGGA